MQASGHQQRYNWKLLKQASHHFIANEDALGVDVCFQLLQQPDLSNFVRALASLNIINYASMPRIDKMRLQEECHTFVARVEQEKGPDNDQLIWLKKHFELVKLQPDQGQGSADSRDEGSGKPDDEISVEKHHTGETREDENAEDEKPASEATQDGDESDP